MRPVNDVIDWLCLLAIKIIVEGRLEDPDLPMFVAEGCCWSGRLPETSRGLVSNITVQVWPKGFLKRVPISVVG